MTPPPLRFSAAARRSRGGFSLVEVALALIVAAGGLLAVFGIFPVSLRQSQLSRSDMIESGFASTLLQTFAGNIRMIDDITDWNDPHSFWTLAASGSGLVDENISRDEMMNQRSSKAIHALHERAKEGDWTGLAPDGLSPKMTYVASTYGNRSGDEENVWYFGAERADVEQVQLSNENRPGSELVQPAQYLVRLACIRRPAMRATGPRRGGGGLSLGNSPLPVRRIEVDSTESHAYSDPEAWLPNVYVLSVISTDRGFPDVFLREPVFSQEFTFIHRP